MNTVSATDISSDLSLVRGCRLVADENIVVILVTGYGVLGPDNLWAAFR